MPKVWQDSCWSQSRWPLTPSLFPNSMALEWVPAASLQLPNPIMSGIQVCEQQHCAPDPGIPKEVCHSWFWGVHGPCGSHLWRCQRALWRQSEGQGAKGGARVLGQKPLASWRFPGAGNPMDERWEAEPLKMGTRALYVFLYVWFLEQVRESKVFMGTFGIRIQ